MKSLTVNINTNNNDAASIVHEYCADTFGRKNVSVTELSTLPEVKMIETGVLMSPAEICKCESVFHIEYHIAGIGTLNHFSKNTNKNVGERLVIKDHNYPREFYRDIETTWDFSSISPRSIIEVVTKQSPVPYYVQYSHVNDVNLYGDRGGPFAIICIKSIRIVERGESK